MTLTNTDVYKKKQEISAILSTVFQDYRDTPVDIDELAEVLTVFNVNDFADEPDTIYAKLLRIIGIDGELCDWAIDTMYQYLHDYEDEHCQLTQLLISECDCYECNERRESAYHESKYDSRKVDGF